MKVPDRFCDERKEAHCMKIRFVEPGNRPYQPSILNYFVYDRYIRTPSVGLNTLATIVQKKVPDTRMYSESISRLVMKDILDADLIFIGIFTFQARRGYALARYFKKHSKAVVVMGGLHASMNYPEAARYCDYVLLGEGDESILDMVRAVQKKKVPDFPGVAYLKNGRLVHTGERKPPETFETIPNKNLVYRYQKMAGHNTLWGQVHASRGCPHDCDYCALVRHFGRRVRTRTPEYVVEDIRRTIAFQERGHHRLLKALWITDDNFFADRKWAMAVLQKIIDSNIHYCFTVQARWEVGLDDEMLCLLKRAGFAEIAMGIEFIDDDAFQQYHKKSTKRDIITAIQNIKRHGLSVRGLFILGADSHTVGVGERLADFVIEQGIQGALIQCMYFVPGTPVYEADKERLLHKNWDKYNGNAVHWPKSMTPYELQVENIKASKKIYSFPRLVHALIHEDRLHKLLFLGEYFWHISVRKDLKRELPYLEKISRRRPENVI
jgi:radical SAM superfamily enzyme YgiQ (UPF0313 family)